MLAFLRQQLTRFVVWLEVRLKGDWRAKKQVAHKHMSTIKAISFDGYEMTIQVNKTVFSQNYDRWFVAPRRRAVYDVHAIVSSDAPKHLRDATSMFQCVIPALLPEYVTEEVQREFVIQAYLDLLIDRIKYEQSK